MSNCKQSQKKLITGTFLDGVSGDIPSQNWGSDEWSRQFDVFREMGMDTVIIIRVGGRDQAMYDSKVLACDVFDPDDRVALFLDQAQRVGLQLYLGVYDSDDYSNMQWDNEISVNLELVDELLERYGEHDAFHGWYLSHEPGMDLDPWKIWNPLIERMKQVTPEKPILLSPRFEGSKWRGIDARTPSVYADIFDHAMGHVNGQINAAAFMDGHVGFGELGDYAAAMKPVLDKHDIEFWSNLETFDRGLPIRFPPIDWLKMRTKLEAVQPYVSKIITFEAPHFLSPYSMWESGRLLFDRYMEYVKQCSKA